MREMPANQLNPRIKSVWRINDAIWIVVSFLCCFLPFAIIALVAPEEAWAGVVALIVAILFVAPILRAFGLSSVTVATAAGEHEIPGLGIEEADVLRDRAAELARLAREDV